MEKVLNVLLIEDNDEHARIIARYARKADRSSIVLVREGRLDAGLKRMSEADFDAILLDLRLPDSDIEETLNKASQVSQSFPIIVLSSLEDLELAIKAVQQGAQDYVCKADLTSELLVRTIHSAIERKHTQRRLFEQGYQNQALFELSRFALSETEILPLLRRATEIVKKALRVDFVNIHELLSENKGFRLVAGLGWNEGVVGNLIIPSDTSTISGLVLAQSVRDCDNENPADPSPVIIPDIRDESRFPKSSFLLDHGVVTSMAVVIQGIDCNNPFGILGAHSQTERAFTEQESSFLQAAANTLASAVQRKKLEDQLEGRVRELDLSHRRKDEFLATLSHELRTPLTVILGHLEMVKASRNLPKELEESFDAIDRNARIETQLVSDALEMSRIITGKMKLDRHQLSMESIIESAIESIHFAAEAKQISIEKRAPSSLPLMWGDEMRLRQVIWNLVSNAVKFTPLGGKIVVSAVALGNYIEIAVHDTGIGIAPENLPSVFERFWQEEASMSRGHMGLGLGLAIVKHVVELHGGTVNVKSDGKGTGTTFEVRIPIFKPDSIEDVALTRAPGKTTQLSKDLAAPEDLRGLRILVVDDSVDAVSLIVKRLQKFGAQVTGLTSPAEALENAKTREFDVLVSDIGMPEIDGLELIRRIRKWEAGHHKRSLPAIALTAYVTEQDAQNAVRAGFQHHFAKPVNFNRLSGLISEMVEGTRH